MGSATSELVKQQKPFWEEDHDLKIDPQLREKQRPIIGSLQPSAKLCTHYVELHGLLLEHWYITDGTYTIEFGDAALQERNLRFFASPAAEQQIVMQEFSMDNEVKRRLRNVCGATNFSLALRNSEHMAKYIASGSWISLQMVGSSALLQNLKRALGDQAKLVNTPPKELVEAPPCGGIPDLIHPDLDSPFAVEFSGMQPTLADAGGLNMVVLGPTGAGKSSVINTLFNRKVARVKASPMSVTRHMDVYSGSFLNQHCERRFQFHVIDSVGFCDSVIPPAEVLQIVKGFIKVNVLSVSKVIIVCACRVERAQADAIKGFMEWLKYKRHKSEFVFIYNKAEYMDEVERAEAVRDMCMLLDADPTYGTHAQVSDKESKQVRYAFAAGFPPRAPLPQVKADLDTLYDAVFRFRTGNSSIRVSESDCQLL